MYDGTVSRMPGARDSRAITRRKVSARFGGFRIDARITPADPGLVADAP
jgi:hypothetical protein